ncbi:MAG TPA: hypothetical protein VGV08_11160 [Casimicrobiaceae bacterium]|nr:hypothetical protein [Casimicrobiaceae bacterium]
MFGTVHPQSVDALFEAAQQHGLRLIAGKVLMDRNAPAALCEDAQRGYDEGKALIGRWHGRGRLAYAVTPRFAATSSPAQLELAATLWRERSISKRRSGRSSRGAMPTSWCSNCARRR